jgi:hypothetical protein
VLDPHTHRHRILIARDLIAIPAAAAGAPAPAASLVTVAANIAHHGYALSAEAYAALARLGEAELAAWWTEVEVVLAVLTGADKKMESFVVYKNFPAEVLAMDQVEYWARQILMYWGLPNELVTQPEAPRAPLADAPVFRVLQLADAASLPRVMAALFALPARWIESQWEDVRFLVGTLDRQVELAALPFVENRIRLAAHLLERGAPVTVAAATDVLRLAAALSGGDVSLREPCKLRRLSRRERKHLLAMLEGAPHLDEDLARRPEPWKRLLHLLHPGDYRDRCPRVVAAYDRLYHGAPVPSFNADLERLLAARDREALARLQTRPGEYMRRLHATLLAFGPDSARAFAGVIGKLTTIQLLKLHRYLETIDDRAWRTFPPRGNWGKVQIVAAEPRRRLPRALRGDLLGMIGPELARRLHAVGPVALAPEARRVKLQTNDGELSPFGRGTVFPIPERVRFVRTATYWKIGPTGTNVWFDNGWNFCADDWSPVGVCAWNATRFHDAAVFSGDPTSSKELEGRACQMIDLYPDRLVKRGVRYAVWTVLCYSRITFAKAIDVHAALQWGERAQAGKLFEPSRCQLSFPLRGDHLTKYVVYLDLPRRELVYIDANLPARVSSAGANGKLLARNMPAFVEYLDSLPSVHDLFAHARQDPSGMPVLYDDADRPLAGGRPAYVFRPANEASSFTPFDVSSLL